MAETNMTLSAARANVGKPKESWNGALLKLHTVGYTEGFSKVSNLVAGKPLKSGNCLFVETTTVGSSQNIMSQVGQGTSKTFVPAGVMVRSDYMTGGGYPTQGADNINPAITGNLLAKDGYIQYKEVYNKDFDAGATDAANAANKVYAKDVVLGYKLGFNLATGQAIIDTEANIEPTTAVTDTDKKISKCVGTVISVNKDDGTIIVKLELF